MDLGNKRDHRKRNRAAGILLLSRFSGIGLAIAVNAFLARTVGAEGIGVLALVVAWAAIAGLVVNAGFPTLLTREVAQNLQKGVPEKVRGLIRWSNQFVLWIALLALTVFLLVFLFRHALTNYLFGTNGILIAKGVLLSIPAIALISQARGILTGLDRAVLGSLPEQVYRPFLFLAILTVFAMLDLLTANSVIMLYVIATFIVAAFAVLQSRTLTPRIVRDAELQMDSRTWLLGLVPLSGIAMTTVFKHQTDILMLGFLAETADVGAYRIASQVAALPGVLMVALNSVYAPRIAALFAVNELHRSQAVLVSSARLMFFAALGATLIFAGIGKPLLNLVFGPDFEVSYSYALVLMAGVVISTSCGQTATILKMTDNTKAVLRASIEASILNVVLNLILIALMGPIGAAIATTIALIWVQVRQLTAIRATLNMNVSAFAKANEKQG